MIVRTWKGAVGASDAESYLAHQDQTGVRDYREAPGNLGVLVLTRPRGDLVEVTTVSLWESMEAVKGFAGEDPERARFYAGDDDWLVEKDLHADHFEVSSLDLAASLVGR